MTIVQEGAALAVMGVKLRQGNDSRDWFASVRVQMTGPDSKTFAGWVHVSMKGYKLAIVHWDDGGDGSSMLVDSLVAAESNTILDAVRKKMESRNTSHEA